MNALNLKEDSKGRDKIDNFKKKSKLAQVNNYANFS